jgi:hypothetical protein
MGKAGWSDEFWRLFSKRCANGCLVNDVKTFSKRFEKLQTTGFSRLKHNFAIFPQMSVEKSVENLLSDVTSS